jgi:hypothetical protein
MMRTEEISETLVLSSTLTRLIYREVFSPESCMLEGTYKHLNTTCKKCVRKKHGLKSLHISSYFFPTLLYMKFKFHKDWSTALYLLNVTQEDHSLSVFCASGEWDLCLCDTVPTTPFKARNNYFFPRNIFVSTILLSSIIYSYVYGVFVTNNNGLWIWWLDLLTLLYNYC